PAGRRGRGRRLRHHEFRFPGRSDRFDQRLVRHPPKGDPGMSNDLDALGAAVDAENAAIFTYGVTTAFIGRAERPAVAEFIAEHRIRRTELNDDLVAAGGKARTPATGYQLPVEVKDPQTSATVLLDAEEDCARAYRAMLEQVEQD